MYTRKTSSSLNDYHTTRCTQTNACNTNYKPRTPNSEQRNSTRRKRAANNSNIYFIYKRHHRFNQARINSRFDLNVICTIYITHLVTINSYHCTMAVTNYFFFTKLTFYQCCAHKYKSKHVTDFIDKTTASQEFHTFWLCTTVQYIISSEF